MRVFLACVGAVATHPQPPPVGLHWLGGVQPKAVLSQHCGAGGGGSAAPEQVLCCSPVHVSQKALAPNSGGPASYGKHVPVIGSVGQPVPTPLHGGSPEVFAQACPTRAQIPSTSPDSD